MKEENDDENEIVFRFPQNIFSFSESLETVTWRGSKAVMLSKIVASLLLVLTSFAYCEHHLPTNTKPLSYYLSLTTYIHEEDYSFFGFVDIHIRALDTTDTITLHSENLDDLEVTLRDTQNNPPKVYHNLTYIQDEANDFLRIETPDEVVLQEGQEYTLSISFVGEMTNDSFGFYKMDFADAENRKVYADDIRRIYRFLTNFLFYFYVGL